MAAQINLTMDIGRILDTKRLLFQGSAATLSLLDHKPTSGRGYTPICQVTSGWRFIGRTGQPGKLEIAESEQATLKRLQTAQAFGINGEVYILAGNADATTKPTSDTQRKWSFDVVPTGEQVRS